MLRNKRWIFTLLLLVMMLLGTALPQKQAVQAEMLEDVVDSLEIVNKKDKYFPGDMIYLKGHWRLDDDCTEKSYHEGDQFKISVPDGFTPIMKTIQLGEMGEGVWDGSGFVFTFSENIEHLIGREGGFNIGLQLDAPEEKDEISREIVFDNGKGHPLLKETIVINNQSSGIVGPSNEIFTKGSYPIPTEKGIRWYIRVNPAVVGNKENSLPDKRVTIVDRVLGDQQIVPGSFKINVSDDPGVGQIAEGVKEVLDEDLKGFQLELDLSDDVWYNIEYETEYVGKDFNLEKVVFENEARAFGDVSGPIPMDGGKEDNIVEQDFYLGGWGKGKGVIGNVKILKKDADYGHLLAGAQFELVSVYDDSKMFKAESNEDGEAFFEKVPDGLYYLREVKAPKNYEAGEEQVLNIRYNEDNDYTFEQEVTNKRKKVSFKGEKHWFNADGDIIESQEDVVLQLYGDGELKRQMVLKKGQKNFEFKNVPAVNEHGEEIKFEIKEIVAEGYQERIEFDKERGLWIVENHQKPTPQPPSPKPVEPEKPVEEKPEKPVEETPEEPEPETEEVKEVSVEKKEPALPQTGQGMSLLSQLGLSVSLLGFLLYLKQSIQ